MKKFKTSLLLSLVILLLVSTSLSAAETNLKSVKIGITPYAFAMMFPVIHTLGIDNEIGIDFDIYDFSSSAGTFLTLIRGDIDIVNEDMSVHIGKIKNAPEIKTFGTNNMFKGFILIGRKGVDKSYQEVLTELGDPEKAKEKILKSIKGRKFVAAPFFSGVISDALGQVGIKLEDIEYIKFADDEKAAAAFIGGVGDFYLGSLPQEIKMLNMPDNFVNMGGNTEIMGPASLYYGGFQTTEKYLKENYDTILRVCAAFYRGARYLQEAINNEDKNSLFIKLMVDNLNKRTAGNMSYEDMFNMEKNYEEIFTYKRAGEIVVNPDSKLYWKITGDYQMKTEISVGHLDKELDLFQYIVWDQTYKDLSQREDLVEFIEKPLTSLK